MTDKNEPSFQDYIDAWNNSAEGLSRVILYEMAVPKETFKIDPHVQMTLADRLITDLKAKKEVDGELSLRQVNTVMRWLSDGYFQPEITIYFMQRLLVIFSEDKADISSLVEYEKVFSLLKDFMS